jgi:predicted O-methyltransferase YrrM
MPYSEGAALFEVALTAEVSKGPLLEIGGYCGKSACYLGLAAESLGSVLFSVDHHRAGWAHHESDLVDPESGLIDTLSVFRATILKAGLEGSVVPIVGDSTSVARYWSTPLSFLFIDGGHGQEPVQADFKNWVPKVAQGGFLAIHDVFDNPNDGGQAPRDYLYLPALESGEYVEILAEGSLRVLRRQST